MAHNCVPSSGKPVVCIFCNRPMGGPSMPESRKFIGYCVGGTALFSVNGYDVKCAVCGAFPNENCKNGKHPMSEHDLTMCGIIGRQSATIQGSLQQTAILASVSTVKYVVKLIDEELAVCATNHRKYVRDGDQELVGLSLARTDALTSLREQLSLMMGAKV